MRCKAEGDEEDVADKIEFYKSAYHKDKLT